MDYRTANSLGALPQLDPASRLATAIPCKICGTPAPIFDVTDFWKELEFYRFGLSGITVKYYRCDGCGFMFTPFCDDWTPEDFRLHIYNDQYILLDPEYSDIRPHRTAAHMADWLRGFEDARILDYGSGSGLFAEHMRNAGFHHVTNYDPFSDPKRPAELFDLITCIEVIEHSPTPIETLSDLASFLNQEGCIVLSEMLQPPDIATIRCNWWYCMPRNGHISLYTDMTLAILARRVGLLFHPGNGGQHAFTRPLKSRFTALGDCISRPLLPVTLNAPCQGEISLWHSAELFSRGLTRWTAVRELSWCVAIPAARPGRVSIRIPFTAEIRPGFSAESQILVNGAELKTQVLGQAIVTELSVDGTATIEVTLRTPEPLRPSDLRGSPDHRRLGLAIPCVELPRRVGESRG
jgi:SAM-dependent methyltransferase